MALNIETFDNRSGGNSYYKAVSHPLAAERAAELMARLEAASSVALYDPLGYAPGFAAFYPLTDVSLCGVYVQDISKIGASVLGHRAQPVTDLAGSDAQIVLVAAFEADRLIAHIKYVLPAGCEAVSLDALRLPPEMLSNPARYLDPMNFATNFAFFRDDETAHTTLVTANYWARYGAKEIKLWARLFDHAGDVLAEWIEPVGKGSATIVLDSAEIRSRFGLGAFTGQLFLHAIGATGHDVVKYALDTWYGDKSLSCTHDANAWPSDWYAGLPAPGTDEDVVLWIQNSHPCEIPAGSIGVNVMGNGRAETVPDAVGPYATLEVSVGDLLPDVAWPVQLEVSAGKHFVRPRYEIVTKKGDRRIAHMNVERSDLKPDPGIPEIGNLMGKGYILPAPILPVDTWRSIALPTPMARGQAELPMAILAIDSEGNEVARLPLGRLPRNHDREIDLTQLFASDRARAHQYGHAELVYDFADGGEADGWLHGLFRYENAKTGNFADTSFGAHIFNTVLTYRNEPQSYTTRAPGLSTRLFLRLGPAPTDTICQLIYPASTPWHGKSETTLHLHDGNGDEVAETTLAIPCGGSRLFRYSEIFDTAARTKAGPKAHIIIRDTTCRLFGYHGLVHPDGDFSLDHMFGF